MEGIIIQISWEYFLGILGALIAMAWYSNGRLTALETSMEWVKDMLLDLKKSIDDANAKEREGTPRNEAETRKLKQQTRW